MMTENTESATLDDSVHTDVEDRFDNLLIMPERVQQMYGKRGPADVTYQESEQADARRRLLRVEKVAIQNRVISARQHADLQDEACHLLHAQLLPSLIESSQDTAGLFNQWLQLSDPVTQLIESLSSDNASVSSIERHAASLPWLYDSILPVVNAPQYRRRDSRGRVIVVDTLRTALSFLGIDNLQVLIPTLVLKRALPNTTDPFPRLKHSLSQFSLMTANSARLLAPLTSVPPIQAYMFATLMQLGKCALFKLYFRLFDQTQRTMLEQAQKDRQRELHDALLPQQPSAEFLIALMHEFSEAIAQQLFDHMLFRRLPFNAAVHRILDPSSSTSLGDGLAHNYRLAEAYAKVRMLSMQKLVDANDVRHYLRTFAFPVGAIQTLIKENITQIPLRSYSGE